MKEDDLAKKIAEALKADDAEKVHIFDEREVEVIKKVIGWVEFAGRFGTVGRLMFQGLVALGGAYLLYRAIVEKVTSI